MSAPIRNVRAGDATAVYEICLLTADAGNDGRTVYRDPDLPGHVWAGPYVALEPEHGFVVTDEADVPVGYVLGAADSRRFEAAAETSWWPDLRVRYPVDADRTGIGDRLAVQLIHRPSTADPDLVDDFPSHLHIDLLPAAQGRGDGRRLIERFVESVATAGSTGVHLGVSPRNPRAIGFYEALGFGFLVRDDHRVVMGRRI